ISLHLAPRYRSSTHSRRIFLSYGHNDQYPTFAGRLASDLRAHGHELWFDQDRLMAGRDWDALIESGLNWTAQGPNRGCLVLLMTPHAVRRPGGYCLNELTRAIQRDLLVVPLMVTTVEPPLAIARLQWLDLRGALPPEEQPGPYARKLDQLLKA